MPHIHNKIDFVVDVYVVFKNKVLLRKHDKYKIWLVPGGHIELDEDPVHAAAREVKEEVGLDVEIVGNPIANYTGEQVNKELIPPKFLNMHRINNSHEHISFVYFGKAKTDKIVQSDGDEISEGCRWFSIGELEDSKFDLRPHVKEYARLALKELGV